MNDQSFHLIFQLIMIFLFEHHLLRSLMKILVKELDRMKELETKLIGASLAMSFMIEFGSLV